MGEAETILRDAAERSDRALKAALAREFLRETFESGVSADSRARVVSGCCFPMTPDAVYAHDHRIRKGEDHE